MSNVGTDNPYAAPTARVADAPVLLDGDIEQLRRDHVRHERQLKSIGSLYWLGAILMGLTTASIPYVAPLAREDHGNGLAVMVVLIYGGITLGCGVIAYGLSALRPWVRIPAIILSGLGLLAIPIGTLINGYALYLLLSKRGATILRPGYAEVIAATPHIRYRRSLGDWIAVILLLAMILAAVGFIFFF